jgi:hypothetical protein
MQHSPCEPVLRQGLGHAIAMHGEPALPENFTQVPYVNPTAPKGWRLVQGVLGTFDSLNPFIVKGIASSIRGYVVESLMARAYDEAFTLGCELGGNGCSTQLCHFPSQPRSSVFGWRPCDRSGRNLFLEASPR